MTTHGLTTMRRTQSGAIAAAIALAVATPVAIANAFAMPLAAQQTAVKVSAKSPAKNAAPVSPTTVSRASAAAIDSVFVAYTRAGSPGCAVGVYENGAVAFARGYGYANLTHAVPITATTRFTVGSVSKQFTAASIALLVRAGRLSLDDDVRKYVPELPVYDPPIRIRHLVHHTSGLRDFWELVDLAGLRPDDGYDVNDMLSWAARQQGLNFTPGAEYRYSNTGYLMLGVVVQRITKQSLRRFADSAIFAPLGMRATLFLDDHNEIVHGRAMAYSPVGSGWRINVWNNDIVGQGGIVTSLADLQKWDENFYHLRVGDAAFLELVQSTEPLSGGAANTYAFGNSMGEYRGLHTVEHTGSTGGYRAALYRFPAQHTSVALLCNVSSANTSILAQRVADIVLRKALKPATVATDGPPRRAGNGNGRSVVAVSASETSSHIGRYVSSELLDAVWEIASGNLPDELSVRRARHAPVTVRPTDAKNTFATNDGSLVLAFDTAGFRLDGSRVLGIRFERKRD